MFHSEIKQFLFLKSSVDVAGNFLNKKTDLHYGMGVCGIQICSNCYSSTTVSGDSQKASVLNSVFVAGSFIINKHTDR